MSLKAFEIGLVEKATQVAGMALLLGDKQIDGLGISGVGGVHGVGGGAAAQIAPLRAFAKLKLLNRLRDGCPLFGG